MSIVLFQITDMAAVYDERLAIILGLVTLLFGLTVFFSCRTCISWLSRLGLKNLTETRGYLMFYRYHLYYWWAFGVLVVAHFLIATVHTGLPQAGDPDANIHWTILGLGLFSFITALVTFSSCRVLPKIAAVVSPKSLFNNNTYKIFFRYHTYYWWIMALLVAAHFTVSYSHAGIWPPG